MQNEYGLELEQLEDMFLESKLTLVQLAEKSGISYATVQKYVSKSPDRVRDQIYSKIRNALLNSINNIGNEQTEVNESKNSKSVNDLSKIRELIFEESETDCTIENEIEEETSDSESIEYSEEGFSFATTKIINRRLDYDAIGKTN